MGQVVFYGMLEIGVGCWVQLYKWYFGMAGRNQEFRRMKIGRKQRNEDKK